MGSSCFSREVRTALCDAAINPDELFWIRPCSFLNQIWTSSRNLSPSYTVTIPATIHHDSSRFEPDGKIGVHWDASGQKKRKSTINTVSHDAPMVSAQFIYGPTTTHDGSATIHHGGAANAHDAFAIRYGASTIQAGSATVVR